MNHPMISIFEETGNTDMVNDLLTAKKGNILITFIKSDQMWTKQVI